MKTILYKTFFSIALLLIVTKSYAQPCKPVPQAERDALIAFYNATNGPNWTNNTNWNTSAPVCDWYGVTVTNQGNQGYVTSLSLSNNQLNGTMPSELGNLTNLGSLVLNSNTLSGNIPIALGNLSNLTMLSLYGNQLVGTIPSELGNLSSLTTLSLYDNQLSGAIPLEIGNLSNLQALVLQYNMLSGPIPPSISTISSLYLFKFNDNAFIFSDFENEHPTYSTNMNSFNYIYSPQAKVDAVETPSVAEGTSYTLTTSLSSPNNSYQWYKDGSPISGATSKDYTIDPVALSDAGTYYVVATNSIVTGLTLQRNDITLTVTTSTCTVPQSERVALLALYNATNGSNWTNNTNWNTAAPVCDWYGITVNNGQVTGLDLNNNGLSGTLPTEIGNLTNLINLILYSNQLTGSIPIEFGGLSNLQTVSLSTNQLSGSIPIEMGNLLNLMELHLSNNQLLGSIPSQLGNLSNLQKIYLDANQLSGSIPIELGNLSSLETMYLSSNQLSGSIPAELGNLSNLLNLSLYNNQLSGSIPSEFGMLSNLEIIHLSTNQLTGNIPSWLGNLSNLQGIRLGSNQLTGSIPPELSNLINLFSLDLSNNQLTGNVPNALSNLTNLSGLSLFNNQLTGPFPFILSVATGDGLGIQNNAFIFNDLESAHIQYLANNTTPYVYSPQAKVDAIETPSVVEGTSYTFTTSLSSPNNSYQWYKDDVLIPGATTKDYTINPIALTDAGVYHVVATNSIVTGLTLQRNDVILTVTPDTCGVSQTERDALLALYNATDGPNWTNNTNWNTAAPVCDWYGVTVTNGSVSELNLNSNNLNGTIPSEIGDLSSLTELTLTDNQLSGTIPATIGNLTNLTKLAAYNNQLSGAIPIEIGNLTNLTILSLINNQLSGSIPGQIGNLTNLTSLFLNQNQLSGSIPIELRYLTNLVSLWLQDNQLTGTIPEELTEMTNLRGLTLYNNLLIGPIPTTIANLTNLTGLNLSNNQLTGTIPTGVGNIAGLNTIWFSNNQLTGTIPSSLVNLSDVFVLNLNNNQFSGPIPDLTSVMITGFPESSLTFENNNFIFNDFENEHLTYEANIVTYTYSPQAKVDTVDTPSVTEGSSYTFTTSLSSPNNSYQWYKDGTPISGATSHDYTIDPVALTDAGVYYVVANNSVVTGLTLQRNDVTLSVTLGTCTVPQSERDALIAFYNATNGPNWLNNTNWNTAAPVCDWYGVTVTNGNVTTLDLQDNGLTGPIPSVIGDLTNLTDLYLYNNSLGGSLPVEIGNLTNLQNINLENTGLSGSIPSELGNLISLQSLYFDANQLTGSIPTEIGNLTNLTNLSFFDNQLSGSIPVEIGNLTNLLSLSLSDNQLSGSIPPELGNLSSLTTLSLSGNQLTGSIPVEIGNLTNLQHLSFYSNQLTGSIPTEFGSLTNLTTLAFYDNQISGDIPDLTGLTNLNYFQFQGNNFVFSNFENEHPTYLANLTTYTYSPQAKVDATETPSVTEGSSYTFTTSLSSLNNSYQWYKDGSPISGATGHDYTIDPVALSDAGTYYVIANNSIVTGLTLQRNDVTLTVTPYTCDVPQIEIDALMALYNATDGPNWTNTLASNQPWDIGIPVCDWYGVVVTNGVVTGLNLSNNGLSGTLPNEIGNLINMEGIYLNSNQLSGSIPQQTANLTSLKYLYLYQNQLQGSIPSGIGNIILTSLDLSNNELTGNIPNSFVNFKKMHRLKLNNNQLSGVIPDLTGAMQTTFSEGFFTFDDNRFIFSDFENEHPTYLNLGPIVFYGYAPQAKVDQIEMVNLVEGSNYPLSTSLSSPNNTYQWYKDGVAIPGATEHDYVVTGATEADQGVYYMLANNTIITGLILERNPINVIVSPANSFCISEWDDYPTFEDLTPSGSNIVWYPTETGGLPYLTTDEIDEEWEGPTGTVYWYDDTNDGTATRFAVTVYVNQNTPEGDEVQVFGIGQNATIANLQASGTNVQWYDSIFSQTPLSTGMLLVDAATYYAEDVGISTCRLAVDVIVATLPPTANSVQYTCPGNTLGDLVVTLQSGATVVWYQMATGGTSIPDTTLLTDGYTYYVGQIDSDSYESEDRTAITVHFFNTLPPYIPFSVQEFYSDQPHKVENLLAIGYNIKWYSQATGGTLYANSTELVDGQTYYAEQFDGRCTSSRVPILVVISTQMSPTIIGCEKFKPQFGDRYVISGWVREQGVIPVNPVTKFFDNSEISILFVDLLNHIKDRLINSGLNLPDPYIPESEDETLNFDPLVPYVAGGTSPGENKLTIYNFERIEDDYAGLNNGRLIGFKFSLSDQGGAPVFEYRTPTISFVPCNSCYSPNNTPININYPLLSSDANILNFTGARVSSNTLYITQTFNAANPLINYNAETAVTGNSVMAESVVFTDFEEVPNYQPLEYINAKVRLEYTDINGAILSSETLTFIPAGHIIDGWQRVVGEFTVPNYDVNLGPALLKIELINGGSDVNAFFDDIRVHPFDSNMKTFVYDPVTQRLMAELDENNYATYYEYDTEGGLVRVKKETERGIYTIQETRSGNTKTSSN